MISAVSLSWNYLCMYRPKHVPAISIFFFFSYLLIFLWPPAISHCHFSFPLALLLVWSTQTIKFRSEYLVYVKWIWNLDDIPIGWTKVLFLYFIGLFPWFDVRHKVLARHFPQLSHTTITLSLVCYVISGNCFATTSVNVNPAGRKREEGAGVWQFIKMLG